MNCKVGEEIGYSIRFEDVTSAKTRIKFLTDGLLLREALVDPLLSRYSVIMVDEAHERSLSTDILLGILKKIHKKRPELRIIISSATLQAEEFLKFFTTEDPSTKASVDGDAIAKESQKGTIFYVSGRSYPVDIHHLEQPCDDYLTQAVSTIMQIHSSEPDGDILVFLTGQEEIHTAHQLIADRLLDTPAHSTRLLPIPLYAGLPTDAQMAVFDPAPDSTRKVILSTNIAEASLTISGIVYVIDAGHVKQRIYNPSTSISSLLTIPISRASATQRAGRAGRTKPGKCYRLYTQSAFDNMAQHDIPELQRSDLAPTILQLKALGVDNIARFPFFTAPPSALVTRALDHLYSLGALDIYAKLTKPLGVRMAELAVPPQLAKALLSAPSFGCQSEMLSICAMAQLGGNQNVWFDHGGESRKAMEASRRKFAAEEGDHATLLNVYTAFVSDKRGNGRKQAGWCRDLHLNFKSLSRAVSIRNQLRRYLERFGIDVRESLDSDSKTSDGRGGRPKATAQQILRCLTSGFFAQAARMQPDGSYASVSGGTTLHVHPTSLMFNRKADWVIFYDVVETGAGGKVYMRDVSKIEKGWLTELAPDFYSVKR